MREIKFRGKSLRTGKWVYGSLVRYGDGRVEIYTLINPRDENSLRAWLEEVDPATVGQYTGLKDKNGKEIYEGDICNCREYECFGKVEWNNEEAGFYFCVVMEGGGFEEEHLYDYVDELEVIGNIYENPALIEGSAD